MSVSMRRNSPSIFSTAFTPSEGIEPWLCLPVVSNSSHRVPRCPRQILSTPRHSVITQKSVLSWSR
jgi:hypothetical protein